MTTVRRRRSRCPDSPELIKLANISVRSELVLEKSGDIHHYDHEHQLIIGSGVNVTGVRRG